MTADDLRKADDALRIFDNKAVKSACYAPFVSLYLTPTGSVQACCRNQNFVLGHLKEQRLTEIWNGGRINALRKALTDYKFNLGCTYCEWESQRRSDSFAIRLMCDHLPVDSPQPEWPSLIEFNGSNTCNLECIMCGGEYSSAIRANVDGLPPLAKVYDDRFFEDLRQFLPHLQFINFLGGEPFLGAEAHRIWDMMIEDGLAIPCRVTTNGTQYNAKVERAISAIPMHITVSLDGVTKETYEMIRHRSNFESVIANLHRFHAYTQERGMNFGISFCLMRQNWRELGEMVLFAEKLDCELSIVMEVMPSHCSLFTLPPHELRGVTNEIERISEVISPQLRRHRKAWDETVQHLRAAAGADQMLKIESVMSSFLLLENPIVRAKKLADEGAYEKALRKLNGVREDHEEYYFALALAGYIRGRLGDTKGADADFDHAIRVSRKLPDAYLNRAWVRFHQGMLDAALENALLAKERVVPESRSESQLLVLLGFIYARRWRLFRAYQTYARLAALPPPSRKGVLIPDSREGARRALGIQTGNGGFLDKNLAFRAHTLFRLASGFHGILRHVRTFDFIRSMAGRSTPSQATLPGDTIQRLLPAGIKKTARWTLRVASVNNKARLLFPTTDRESVRVAIEHAEGGFGYDIQLNYAPLTFTCRRSYLLSFRVRADRPRTVGFGIAKAVAPWSNIGLYRTLEVDHTWKEIREAFVSEADEENGRLHFDLGESGVPFEVASLTLTEAKLNPESSTAIADAPMSK